jgi:hypothetical protein
VKTPETGLEPASRRPAASMQSGCSDEIIPLVTIHDLLVETFRTVPGVVISNAQYREVIVAHGFAPKSDQPNDHAAGNRGTVCRCASNRENFPVFAKIGWDQYRVNDHLRYLNGVFA